MFLLISYSTNKTNFSQNILTKYSYNAKLCFVLINQIKFPVFEYRYFPSLHFMEMLG